MLRSTSVRAVRVVSVFQPVPLPQPFAQTLLFRRLNTEEPGGKGPELCVSGGAAGGCEGEGLRAGRPKEGWLRGARVKGGRFQGGV